MKMTLLEMTQDILSSLTSDQINSINDTTESLQVAKIIRQTYFNVIDHSNLPEHYTFFNLTDSGSVSKPTLMYIPTNVKEIKWIKYDCRLYGETDLRMNDVAFLCLEEFLERMYGIVPSSVGSIVTQYTHVIGAETFNFIAYNNKGPQWYTVFDDHTLLFDSYDSGIDSTLQSSKTLAWGLKETTFSLTDTFTPPIDEEEFVLLYNASKALAFAELNQMQHASAEKAARRGLIHQQHGKFRAPAEANYQQSTPNYGRK